MLFLHLSLFKKRKISFGLVATGNTTQQLAQAAPGFGCLLIKYFRGGSCLSFSSATFIARTLGLRRFRRLRRRAGILARLRLLGRRCFFACIRFRGESRQCRARLRQHLAHRHENKPASLQVINDGFERNKVRLKTIMHQHNRPIMRLTQYLLAYLRRATLTPVIRINIP